MTNSTFAVAAALVMGCATSSHDSDATRAGRESTTDRRDSDPSAASVLRPGVSTLEDAKRLLGEPAYTAPQAGNKLLCVWNPAASGQMSMSSKPVTLTFGPDGRLLESP